MPASPVYSVRSGSVEEYFRRLQGWRVDGVQLDAGRLDGRNLQVRLGCIHFKKSEWSRRLLQRGSSPRGTIGLGFPVRVEGEGRFLGQRVSPDSILIAHPGREFEAVTPPGYEQFPLALRADVLLAAAEGVHLGAAVERSLRSHHLRQSSQAARRFRCFLRSVETTLRDRSGSVPEGVALALEQEILSGLVHALADASGATGDGDRRARDRAMARLGPVLAGDAPLPTTVFELCRIGGVCERTLRYAFYEKYSVSPKSFLKSMLLHRVRRDLLHTSNGNKPIHEIAGCWGFWHMGQFARDYFRQFGELPSSTFSNAQGHRGPFGRSG